MSERPRGGEVAVLGAGVLGCLVARALARRKLTPIVLARGGPRSGLAGVPSAPVWDHTELAEIARLGLDSVDRFQQLEEQIGSFGYLMTGGLAPAWTDADASAKEAFARVQAEAALPVRWLPRDEVLQREPALDAGIRGATYSPREGVLDANLLARRVCAAAGALGATFIFHAGYVSVEASHERFLLRSAAGSIEVRKLVVTSGRWAAEIAAQLGLSAPVRAVRQRVMVTEALPPLLRHRVSAVRQESGGRVLVERVADDAAARASSADAMRGMAAHAGRLAPALASARVMRTWEWRGMVSPARPLVGEIDDGIYVAVPHAPGVSLAPLLAHAVAAAAVEGRVPDAVASWTPERIPAAVTGVRKDSQKGP
jgi:glycine/D-amino acid oxidase-like deaminating enzyme